MTRRYYHPDLPSSGGLIQLTDEEAQHAIRVMRVQTGDVITLFDGRGHEAEAEVVSVSRRDCHCRSETAVAVDRESSIKLHLGIALPKPDRAKELIERLTELGVQTITPIVGARTQRPPGDALLEKLRRTVIEASKQCARNQLLMIEEPRTLIEFLSQSDVTATRWAAHPTGHAIESTRQSGKNLIALIGPEGGWSDQEVALCLDSGFEAVSLGKRILRIETAAAMIAAISLD